MSKYAESPEFRFGEGKISGWISVVLGSLRILGVLCFHFPDFLTTPELRQAYTADQMRYLLGAGTIFSAAFGLITFLYVDGPLLARCFAVSLIRSLAPICPACLCART